MNLLNKKLKDKLKESDDIDNKYIINDVNSSKNNNKNKNNNFSSLENLKKQTNEHFDSIYSDFILEENSYYFHNGGLNERSYLMNNNNLDKTPTKENSIEKEKNKDLSPKDDEEFQNPNDKSIEVGQRLYNYGFYLKNKMENQRRIQENKIKELMQPKTITKSNSNSKNPDLISERLYQNYKKKNVENNNKKTNNKNISNNDKSFSYHPKINKKSLLIAQKLEPSFIRLNKKKKVKNIKGLEAKKYYINLFGNKKINNNNNDISFFKNNIIHSNKQNNNKDNKNIFEKINNLYLRGVEQKQKKEKIYNDHQKKIENEYKNYSFTPKINKNKNIYIINDDLNKDKKKKNSQIINNEIYKKNCEWKKKIEKKIKKDKEKKEKFINQLCTFKPEISEYKYLDDDKFISNVKIQMDEYVNKRRQNIKYKKSEEKYRNKRLGGEANDFMIKSTIPHEFILETEKRNRHLNKNRSCDNFHLNKINFLIKQDSNKKSINNEDDKGYWFFKEDKSYCYSNNNTRGSNKIDETQSQIDFIEAVNLLHDKLGKLNI